MLTEMNHLTFQRAPVATSLDGLRTVLQRRPKLKVDGIIRHEQTAFGKARNDRLVNFAADFLFSH